MATNVSARTTPAVVNGSETPATASHEPSRPLRPNASSSAMPPTTGGRTIGSVVNARTTVRPRKPTRAYPHASGTPRTRASAVAESDAARDSLSASRVSGDASARAASPHGVLTTSPISGATKKAAPIAARIPIQSGARSRLNRTRTWPALTDPRSEEHTSELQSRVDLVCRLLLEKKKKNRKQHSEPTLTFQFL